MACTIDFRRLDEGLGGTRNKRKRADDLESMDLDSLPASVTAGDAADSLPPSKRAALPSPDDPSKPAAFGHPTYDGVIAGRQSGRKWKQARPQRASSARVSRRSVPFEQRAQEKEVKRAFRERKEELKEEIRSRKVDQRRAREEREKRKQENILRTGTKLQKITNPKTLKKITKSKQRKQLKIVPDELLNKSAGAGKKK